MNFQAFYLKSVRFFVLFLFLCGALILLLSPPIAANNQAAAAVEAFGRGGYLTLNGMTGSAVDVQSDGKIIVAGRRTDDCNCLLLRRYHEDGRLDLTFGDNGRVTDPNEDDPYSSAYGSEMLVDDQDRILVVSGRLLARYTVDGQLDRSFTGDGFILANKPYWTDVDLDSKGRIVVAGYIKKDRGGEVNFAAARYLENGASDSDFSQDGFAEADFGGFWDGPFALSLDYGFALAIDENDKIIVAGTAQDSSLFDTGGEQNLAVMRFKENGSVDGGFADDGYGMVDLSDSSEEYLYDVQVLPDGHIMLIGQSAEDNDYGLALVKLRENGGYDNTFASNGRLLKQITEFGDSANALHTYEDGRFLISGGSGGKMLLMRFYANGLVDPTFSISREISGVAYDMVQQEDGKLVVVGNNRLARFNEDGTLDRSYFAGDFDNSFAGFNERGIIAETDFYIHAVSRQEDGSIIAAGWSRGLNGIYDESSAMTVKRYTPDGFLDTNFGESGTALIDLKHSVAYGVAVHPNGNIVVSGSSGSYVGEFFTVAALTPDGQNTWVRLLNPADDLRIAHDVAIDNGGNIVAVGSALDGGDHDFILARLNEFGIPDSSFGTGGLVHSRLGESERATHVVLQPDGKIVAAGTRQVSNLLGGIDTDFIIARYDQLGALDDSFHGDGRRSVSIGDNELLGGLSIEPATNRIVLAGNKDGHLAVARLNPDGGLDTTFDDDGTAVYDNVGPAGGVDAQLGGRIIAATTKDGVVSLAWLKSNGAWGGLFQRGDGALLGGVADMERQPDGKYLIAAGSTMARFTPDGEPDFSGSTAYDTTPYENKAYGMAVQQDGRIVVVGEIKYSSSNYGFSAVRYMPNGEVDRTFADNGRYQYSIDKKQVADNVAILAGGRIAITGWSDSGTQGANFLTMILSPDGVDQKTLFLDFDGGSDVAQEVLPQEDGGFIIVGHADINGQREIALARYTAAGRLDTNFGSGGKVTTFVGTGGVYARGATQQPDGKILVAGAHASNYLILRYNPDGSLDTLFGIRGIVDVDYLANSGEEEAKDIVVLPDGKIAVSGYSSGNFGLLFLYEDGDICHQECNSKLQTGQPFLYSDFGGIEVPFAMAVQPDGAIIIAGGARGTYPTESSFLATRYVWRFGFGYEIDPIFAERGKLIDDLMPSAVVRDIALDGQGRLLMAGYGHNYREYDFLLARYLTNSNPPPVSNPIERIYLPTQENVPGSGWRAGIQVQNTGTEAAIISYSGLTADGTEFSCGARLTQPGGSANFLTNASCPDGHPLFNAGIVNTDKSAVAISSVSNGGVGAAGGQYRGTNEADTAMSLFFPLVKHNHSGRSTAFSVQNSSGEAANISAVFKVNGQTYTRQYSAVPGLTSVLVTPADAGVPAGNGQVGSLSVTGNRPLAGASLEYEHNVAVAQNLQTAAAFGPADYDRRLYCPLYRNAHAAKNQTSGVQAQNVSGAAQTITLTYTPVGGGSQVTRSQRVEPGASVTFYAPAIGIPAGSVGSVVLRGEQDIVAVVNENGTEANGRRTLTTYQCFPAGSATVTVMIPLYKEFYGGNSSGIQVQNVSGDGSTAVVEVAYRATNSSAQAVFTHSTPIPDSGSITFWGVSTLSSPSGLTAISGTPSALNNTYGSVVITSNKPIVAIANEASFGSNGSGQDSKNYEGFNQ